MTLENQTSKNETVKEWVNLYTDYLYQWTFKKTSSKEISEDLVQDTFLAAYNSFEKFQNKSQPKTWLVSILNNKIIDYYRSKYKEHDSFEIARENQTTTFIDSTFDPSGNWVSHSQANVWSNEINLLDNVDFLKIMKSCMDDLPKKWRIAINYKYLTEKKAVDICKELDISTTNYWQLIHRAKLLLKKCIEINWES
ncbi:MAG: sigma-70 family RNA polymerase sigma factor [Bacteroidota bacterium]|nr:sigma-70 family RNA polymerase sigma factor [Bacteroidota bacterium]